jgi:hypothetical protein
MAKIFLGYSQKDIKSAQQLKDFLEKNGFDVFLSAHSVNPGESWSASISKSILSADYYLPIISKNFSSSSASATEIALAIASMQEGKLTCPPKNSPTLMLD